LDYLHTQDPQIIHRDIKPQNLKLSARNQIILLDFGLAKGQLGDISRVSTASIFGYTPNYAPLEQIQGLGTDPRSDIYALAATLYHLLTGVKPPDGLTRAAAVVNGQPDPLLPANEIVPAVGPSIAVVLHKAMSQNREQRYASAAVMRTALRTSNEVTIGGRDEAATVLFASPSTAPTKLAGSPTVPVTLVSTGETTIVQSPPRKSSALPWGIAAGALVLLLCVGGAGFFYVAEQRKNAVVAQPSPSPVENITIAQPSPSAEPSAVKGADSKPAESAKDARARKTEADKQQRDEEKRAAAERKQREEEARRDAEEAAAEQREAEAERARQERERAREERERERERKQQQTPEPPDPGYIEVPGPGGTRRRIPTVRNRTLPDGTKITTTPNGTRIVTLPDGTTRVLPPPGPKRRARP